MKLSPDYYQNVFINCPFDDPYEPLFNAILFTVHRCGFILRCSKEFEDSSGIRIENIVSLIKESCFSIHDLSRVSIANIGDLPRFNMPLELGICIGAEKFGSGKQKDKKYLILESHQYRFKQFISDLSGQDIKSHEDKPDLAIKCVRDWLSKKTGGSIPSASEIVKEYAAFKNDLPDLCNVSKWNPLELTFSEYSSLVVSWLSIK
jgi:hypothetical protein